MSKFNSKTNPETDAVFQHLAEWQEGLNRLEEEVKTVQKEYQAQYQERIAELRLHLQTLQADLQAVAQAGENSWSTGWSNFHNSLASLRHRFMETAAQIRDEEKVDLGWLQGFSDRRTHESEGWAEGLGQQGNTSEGWVEGYRGH